MTPIDISYGTAAQVFNYYSAASKRIPGRGLACGVVIRYAKDFTMSARILVELIEADVEQGFSLVDMAEEAAILCNYDKATRILQAAERVFLDIEQRLLPLRATDACPFFPLIGELRRAIDRARSHIPG